MSNKEYEILYHSKNSDGKEDEKLLEPVKYILQVPGKQIRRQLIKAFNYWMQVPNDKIEIIVDIVNILHTSSLLIDDIQDNSTLRRGIPVAHSIYGIASTFNAANYITIIAMEKVFLLQHPMAIEICMEQLLDLHRGQGMDIFWRDNLHCPSETEYKAMIIKKSGGLFNLGIKLMKLFTKEEDYSTLIETLSLYFQIRDDYCNLCLDEYTKSKTYCEDLSEGKFSFPIVHAITKYPEDKKIIKILKQRPTDMEMKRYCVKLLEDFGCFAYTREVLEELDKKIRTEIKRLGGNLALTMVMDKLKNWN